MPVASSRCLPLLVLAGFLFLVCGLSSRGRDAADQPAQPAGAPKDQRTPGIYRAVDCKACHNQDQNRTYEPNEREQMICRMNEWQWYDQHDKHQTAFNSLIGDRGRGMAERLGYKQATEITACLNCHALREPGAAQPNAAQLAEGVTCVACHGPFLQWVEIHPRSILSAIRGRANPPQAGQVDWTKLDRREKDRDFGMTDLWDPVRRAETCASCHIGNHCEEKVVTHAMYAAGHPPLPSFETATFSDAQPRHWEYLREKQKMPKRAARLKPPPDLRNLEQAQLVVVSGLVSLRESMKLFADQAKANKPEPVGAEWPDFARFDCSSCHHDLRAEGGASWRQVRRGGRSPGRPGPPDWPAILIQLGIEAAGPQQAPAQNAQLERLLAAFHESVMMRPFGDREAGVRTARSVERWADLLLKSLERTTFDEAQARRLLERLCQMASNSLPDYESARQIAWAFRIIYHEITPEPNRDAVIEHALADIAADLALNLPPGQEKVPIEKGLRERLRKVANFDPELFQAHFEMIVARL